MSSGIGIVCSLALISLIQISSAAQATVLIEPKGKIYAQVGLSFKLTCTDDSPTPESNLLWKFSDSVSGNTSDINAVSGSNFFINTVKESNPLRAVSTLKKEKVTKADAGIYICQRKNDDSSGYHVTIATLQVTGSDVEMVPKESNSLQCSVDGAATLAGKTAVWYKDGNAIAADKDKYQILSNNNTLVINKADYKDAGGYVCQFTDDSGNKFNHTVYLLSEAHVKHFDRSKNLVQGDNLLLECHAYGYPVPSVVWYKGDQPVSSDGRVTFEDNDGLENSTLRIEGLTFDDRADYTCVAANNLGAHNSTIIVRVKDKLAALWPFLGICAEVAILCLIIFIYERHRAKKLEEEEMQESAAHDMTNSNDHKVKDDVRQRK